MTERAELKKLVRKHRGNLTAIAAALLLKGDAVTRQCVAWRLQKYKLEDEARKLRLRYNVSGPRIDGFNAKEEKARFLGVLAKTKDKDAACRKLRISRRTLLRRQRELKISERAIARARR